MTQGNESDIKNIKTDKKDQSKDKNKVCLVQKVLKSFRNTVSSFF